MSGFIDFLDHLIKKDNSLFSYSINDKILYITFHIDELTSFKNYKKAYEHIEKVNGRVEGIIIDLKNIEYMDSTGTAFLFSLLKTYHNNVTLKNIQPPIYKLLEILEVTEFFKFMSDEETKNG